MEYIFLFLAPLFDNLNDAINGMHHKRVYKYRNIDKNIALNASKMEYLLYAYLS